MEDSYGRRVISRPLRPPAILSGCSTDKAPSTQAASPSAPSGSPSGSPVRSSAPAGIGVTRGQLLDADPCGLVDTTVLAKFGKVTVEPDQTCDSCSASVDGPGDALVSIGLKLQLDLSGSRPSGPPQQPRTINGVTVYSEPDDTSLCARDVVAFDDAVVALSASEDPAPLTDPCRVSEALTDSVVRQLVRGTIKKSRYPASSLAKKDACRLLRPAEAARAPGSDGTIHPSFGGHSCTWGEESITEPSVLLIFTPEDPPTPQDGTGHASTAACSALACPTARSRWSTNR